MIHSLLGGIPELVDAEPEFYDTCIKGDSVAEIDHAKEDETVSAKSVTRSRSDSEEADILEQPRSEAIDEERTNVTCDAIAGDGDGLNHSNVPSDVAEGNDTLQVDGSSLSTKPNLLSEATTGQNYIGSPQDPTLEIAASIPLPESRSASPIPSPESSSPAQSSMIVPQEAASSVDHHDSSSTSGHALPRSRSSSDLSRPSRIKSQSTVDRPPPHIDRSAPRRPKTKPPPLSLTYLLRQADDLLTAYPPSHPSLRVTEIMGPDSTMRTWRPLPISANARDAVPEKLPYNYTDDHLETLVNSSCIVIPSPPPSPPLGPRLPAKKTRLSPRALSKALLDPRKIGMRLGALTPAERRVLFMGALLVVGAAVALKSGRVSCVDGIGKTSGGEALKRLWSGKWTLISSVVAAWGRGLP